MIKDLHIYSLTHKVFTPDELSKLYIAPEELEEKLNAIKNIMQWHELMYLGTCNRIEVIFTSAKKLIDEEDLNKFLNIFLSDKNVSLQEFAQKTHVYSGIEATRHLFRVTSSLDSMVIGEREIITQVRNAFEYCDKYSLTGETIRINIKKTIETAKQVFTDTSIAKKPVSVVSLAFQKMLSNKNISKDSRIVMVGTGQTNTSFAKILKKNGYKKITLFNRTFDKAKKLGDELGYNAFPLSTLSEFPEGFDVLITCTGAASSILDKELLTTLINGETGNKTIIDLALPFDIDRAVAKECGITLIGLEMLRELASKNLKEREKQLDACEKIIEKNLEDYKILLKERKIELAMKTVPEKVKNIRNKAVNEVFAKDLQQMDVNSKELLEKILSYMEKKYISEPMKMAKEIILDVDV